MLAVLSMLSAVPRKPTEPSTLAVLSPYNEQVERLGRAIEDGLQSSLANIAGFKPGTSAPGFESTVDSFQGSEADVVVIRSYETMITSDAPRSASCVIAGA